MRLIPPHFVAEVHCADVRDRLSPWIRLRGVRLLPGLVLLRPGFFSPIGCDFFEILTTAAQGQAPCLLTMPHALAQPAASLNGRTFVLHPLPARVPPSVTCAAHGVCSQVLATCKAHEFSLLPKKARVCGVDDLSASRAVALTQRTGR